ncbi:MAG: hypothetical protein WA117_22820 [Verrucomicrobiia bacterium]
MRERFAPVFVWSVWVLLTVSTVGYVALWSANVPYWDDWNVLVPLLTGEHPLSVGWLMESYSGHRWPFPLLLMQWILRISKGDFTWLMYANALVISLIALGMLLALRRVKGRLEFTDAFIPIVTLGLAHAENLLWANQFWIVMAIAIAGMLLIGLSAMDEPGKGALWAVSVSLVLLPMCGLVGVVLAPLPALWAVSQAIRNWRFHHSRTWSLTIGICALLSLTLVGLQLAYFQNAPVPSVPAGFGLKAKTALEVMSMALGPFATRLWPWSVCWVVLIVASAWMLLARQARSEGRGIGLAVLLMATVLLAASIGHGRAGLGQNAGFADRYVLMVLPILWTSYFIFRLYGQSRFYKALKATLLIVGCLLIGPNWWDATLRNLDRVQEQANFCLDLRNGMPPDALSQRYAHILFQNVNSVTRRLSDMKRLNCGPYRSGGAVPTHRAENVLTFNSALENLQLMRCCLPRRQSPLVQPLPRQTTEGVGLRAIDLSAIVPVGGEGNALNWKLVERTRDGATRELTGGAVVPAQVERVLGILRIHSYIKSLATGRPFRQWRSVRIQFTEPVRMAGRELELVLWNEDKASENVACEIPLYATEETATLPHARVDGAAGVNGALAMHLFLSVPPAS